MEEKSQFVRIKEGLILVLAGLFLYFFNVLKLIPETDNLIYLDLDIFAVLDYLLGISLVVVIFRYHKVFLEGARGFVRGHYGDELAEIPCRMDLVEKVYILILLIMVYLLLIPGFKGLLEKTGSYHHEILLPLNLLFIAGGIFQLVKIWIAARAAIAEAIVYKEPPIGEDSDKG